MICLRAFEDHHEATKQAQRVFETTLYAMDGYRGDRGFATWLRGFTEGMGRCARNQVRWGEESEASGQAVTGRPDLDRAVGRIPEPAQRAFRLVYLGGLSKAEAAEVEQVSVEVVTRRCEQARMSLAESLYASGNPQGR